MRLPFSTPIVGTALLALAAVLSSAGAQETAPAGPPYRYEGDRGSMRQAADGSRVIVLEGHAHVWDDEIDLTGDLGRYYTEARIAELVGNAKAVTESLTLYTDSLRAYEAEERGDAFGNVRLETLDGVLGTGRRGHYIRYRDYFSLAGDARVIDGSTMVQADSITMDRPAGIMEAFGTVSVVDEANRSVVVGEHGYFDRAKGLAIVDSVPELRSRRGSGPLTTVASEWMSFDRVAEISTAVGDVDFRQGTTQAHADTARFVGEDLLILRGEPTVQQQGRVMSGEEIFFHYVESKLHRIEVFGQASLVDSSPDTLAEEFTSIPLANTLDGDSLTIWMEDGEIVRTMVKGRAHSVYLPDDQEKVISVNDVNGDSIDIRFTGGLVDEVLVEGAVTGKYQYLERASLVADSTAVDSLATTALDSLPPAEIETVRADSLFIAAGDSLATGVADSLMVEGGSGRSDFASLAQTVDYQGSTTLFRVQDGRILVGGTAKVEYGTLQLYAEDIHFDTTERELLAEGDPRLIDKDSELVGNRMGYLFEPKTGAVGDGATRFDDGFYYGKHIRRVDQNTLLVQQGTYTTCDLEDPHYHFLARKMKLKVGESVVARQVTFHVSDIPLLALPFYYKSLDSGRHSGILFPNVNLGVSSRDGRYIRDLGYYWATNEYTDFQFLFDYNERRESRFTLKNVYNVRYGVSGSVDAWYNKKFSETQQGDEWKIRASHNQPELWDVWRATASLELSSSTLTRGDNSGFGSNDLIDSELRSRASLSRTFDNGSSLNVNGTRLQKPNGGDDNFATNNLLSQANISVTPSFKSRPLLGGRQRSDSPVLAGVLRDTKLSHNYSSSFARTVNEEGRENKVDGSVGASLSYAPNTPIGIFNYTARVNGGNAWSYRDLEERKYRTFFPDPTDSTLTDLERDPENDLSIEESTNRPSLRFSNGLSTQLYGIFDAKVGPLRGVKHKLSWSANHNYQPEIRDKQTANQDISFSMGNEISLKVLDKREDGESSLDEDGNPKMRKLDQLINWTLNTAYDLDADPGERWADIRSNLRLRPGVTQAISFSMSHTLDPRTLDTKSSSITSDLRLRGNFGLGGSISQRTERKNAVIERLPKAEPDSAQVDPDAEEDFDGGYNDFGDDPYAPLDDSWLDTGDRNGVPWDLSLRGSVRTSRTTAGDTTVNTSLSATANVSLPGEWKLSWRSNFNVETGTFNNQFWTLERKLHDWQLVFRRGLTDGQDFGFSLYLNAIPDLRVDRGDLARSQDFRSRASSF